MSLCKTLGPHFVTLFLFAKPDALRRAKWIASEERGESSRWCETFILNGAGPWAGGTGDGMRRGRWNQDQSG